VADRFIPSGTADAAPAPVEPDLVRVVVADDSYLVREALGHLLDTDPRVTLVATCKDGRELAATVAAELPDVVVTDIRMPPSGDDEGIRFANRLRRTHPGIGVVVVSQYADPRYGLALLDQGSDGRAYLLKDRLRDREHLIAAVRAVAEGGSVVDAKVVEALIAARTADDRSPLTELTRRELEILAHMAQGKSNHAIAEELFLSKRAVEKHINAIFMKLGLAQAEDVSRRVKAALIYLAGAAADAKEPHDPEGGVGAYAHRTMHGPAAR
jgi:DNA-binding NarL/FixJ family response regulator